MDGHSIKKVMITCSISGYELIFRPNYLPYDFHFASPVGPMTIYFVDCTLKRGEYLHS